MPLNSRISPFKNRKSKRSANRRGAIERLDRRDLLAGDLVSHWQADSIQLQDGETVMEWTNEINDSVAALDNGTPTFVANAYGGRAAIRFDAADGDDVLLVPNSQNPVGGQDDFSVAIVFATSSTDLVGGTGIWYQNTGIVDATTLGFSADWGVSINSSGQIGTGMGAGFGQPVKSVFSSETGLNNGELHTAVVTRSGSNLSVYIDGGPATTITDADTKPRTATSPISIGRLLSRSNGFSGDISQIRFYDGQLSAAEVTTLTDEIASYYSNASPVPNDDSYTTTEDGFLAASAANGVLANDTDADGDALTAELVETTANGELGLRSDGSFFYSPSDDFFGIDTFTYRAVDFRGSDTIGTVSIDVQPGYDAPIPVADSYKARPNEVLNIPALVGVLVNDTNVDEAELTAVVSQDVSQGQITLNGDGSFSYDPQGFAGTSFFTYQIDDGAGRGLSASGIVEFIVNTEPVAVNDVYELDEDVVLDASAATGVLANDVDADGDTLTAELLTDVQNGTLVFQADGSFNYTPNQEYSGTDTFTYRLTDGIDQSLVGQATINVISKNDAPIVQGDSYFALPNESLDVPASQGVLANDSDVDGPELTAALVDSTTNGQLTFNADGSFAYTPNLDFDGTDSFTYTVTDSIVTSEPQTVHLQITPRPFVINEIMASNAETLETIIRASTDAEFEGEVLTPDWFEIRNLVGTPINIGGLHLTDDADDKTKWQIPLGTIIPPEGYLVIFASGEDVTDPSLDQQGFLHTNFRLSTAGNYLGLTSATGDVIDEFTDGYPVQRVHVTYGSDANNPESRGYFTEPTPGAENATLLSDMVGDTKFDVDRGFYTEPFALTISSATENAEIYYTTDGTVPTKENGTKYETPLNIDKTTTVRAAAFLDGMVPTNVDTTTYLFLDDILEQDREWATDNGFPDRWRNQTADYGLDDESQFPLIVGDESLSVEEAKEKIAEALTAIPTFSFVLNTDDLFGNRGIYANPTSRGPDWERPLSVEMINPDGTDGFQIDSGIRIQGGAFRGFGLARKKSLRLLFKSTYGDGKLNYPLFGPNATDSFDTLTFRMEANDGWQWSGAGGQPQYARDQFARNIQRLMNQPASHGRPVHVYLNGQYWGMYNMVERPDQSFAEAYLGAEKYEWNGTNTNGPINSDGDTFRRNRTRDDWNEFRGLTEEVRDATTEEEKTELMMKLRGMNPDGTVNPDYKIWLDAENMIDYYIVNYYADNSDWPHKNFYYGHDSGPNSTGFKFFLWDAEWSLFLRSQVRNVSKIRDRSGVADPFQDLRQSEEFLVLMGDRTHAAIVEGGPLYVDPANPQWDPEHPERNVPAAVYNSYVDQIHTALLAESARWGDQHRSRPYTRDVEWQREYDRLMEDWFPVRTENMIAHFKREGLYPEVDAVTISQRGGSIDRGSQITLSAPQGTIYYTTDGSDPRMIGGALNPNAMVADAAIQIDQDVTLRARVLHDNEWSAIDQVSFIVDAVPATADSLRISEVHYNPADASEAEELAGFTNNDEFEFIELVNTSDQTITLQAVQLQQVVVGNDIDGVDFDFADAAINQLAAGERLVVVENLDAFQLRYGSDIPVAGQWSGGLGNGGETIQLGTSDSVFQNFTYDDAWHETTDGDGFSLEVVDINGALENWNQAEGWRASGAIGGSPGTEGGGAPVVGDSNGDGVFDSSDLVAVFTAGEYEDGIANNSTFAEGDWNGDGEFDSSDLVFVFSEGDFEPNAARLRNQDVDAIFSDWNELNKKEKRHDEEAQIELS